MYSKVFLLSVAMTAIIAMPQGEYHHGHANAIFLQKSHEIKYEPVLTLKEHDSHHGHHKQDIDYYAHPKYEYAYEIKDTHTHDIKQQQEHRDGDTVKGEYSFHQPDGTVRIVKYYADKKTGFHADVKYEGHAKHVVPEHHHHY